MSKVYQLRSEEHRYDEGSLWIERLSEGLDEEEEGELQAWLEDPANLVLLEKMAMLWDKMDSLGRLAVLVPQPVAMDSGSNRRSYLALAASIMVGLSALLVWYTSFNTAVDPQVAQGPAERFYETAIGEQLVNTLEDGTEITLNTGSRLGVRFTSDGRLLRLQSGEVHVRVFDDPQRPLSVLVGGRIIQAVGTAFNIELRPDRQIELVVTEGTVRVGKQTASTNGVERTVTILLPRTATVITAGQELVMGGKAEEARALSDAEIEVKLSWHDGNLIFRGESLAEVVQEVERYTGVKFVFVDENLKEVHVSGFFKAGDVEGMLAVLKENFDIEFQREGENRVLLYGM